MKRYLWGGILAVLLCIGMHVQPVHAATNDFTIRQYDMRLELGRDADKRSTLKITETITADFPTIDQNHGLERAVPDAYNGHSVHLSIDSVTDQNGATLPYSDKTDDNGNRILRIGSASTYVHGLHTYKIVYTEHDVTRFYSDTDKDEFYWDLNGTEWQAPIDSFRAELVVAPDVMKSFHQSSCYSGSYGSTDTCRLERTRDGTFVAQASQLQPGQTVTIALGFAGGTFAAYQPTLMERIVQIWAIVQLAASIVGLVLIVSAAIRWSQDKNRKKEIGTIIPEYLPPQEVSVTVSAEVVDTPRAVMTAQLLDFAVRGYIKIIETKPKSFWRAAEYTIEITKDPKELRVEERELLDDVFDGAHIGDRFEMKNLQNNMSFYKRLQDNPEKLKKLVRGQYEMRAQDAAKTHWYMRCAQIAGIAGVLLLSPSLLVAALIIYICGRVLWPLSPRGLELRRYLEGLKLYIGVAEKDRIKILQSPAGAEKISQPIDTNDSAAMVKLYERVLPYAVLFGQEKEWSKQLGGYYESAGTQPGWYTGSDAHAVFNAAVFSSMMTSFSTSSATYTSSSSSSSGGSGGGGFSGGGGGGGGGGGW